MRRNRPLGNGLLVGFEKHYMAYGNPLFSGTAVQLNGHNNTAFTCSHTISAFSKDLVLTLLLCSTWTISFFSPQRKKRSNSSSNSLLRLSALKIWDLLTTTLEFALFGMATPFLFYRTDLSANCFSGSGCLTAIPWPLQ